MLRPTVFGIFLGASLLWTAPVLPQSNSLKPGSSEVVVFIHCGPRQPDDLIVRKIAITLLQQGYLVREPEPDQDTVGGPGVDYFDPQAAPIAASIADTVNKVLVSQQLTTPRNLVPRLQRTNNPKFYFGVWLF
jgi:hypothetical protein